MNELKCKCLTASSGLRCRNKAKSGGYCGKHKKCKQIWNSHQLDHVIKLPSPVHNECGCMTVAGSRCKLKPQHGNIFCGRHKDGKCKKAWLSPPHVSPPRIHHVSPPRAHVSPQRVHIPMPRAHVSPPHVSPTRVHIPMPRAHVSPHRVHIPMPRVHVSPPRAHVSPPRVPTPRVPTPRVPTPRVGNRMNIPNLDDVLSIYKYPFLGDNLSYCQHVFNTSQLFDHMSDSMRLIYPSSFDKNDVFTHLKYRHPIHIDPTYVNGIKKVNYGSIHEDKMKKVLGYDKSTAHHIDTIPALKDLRYSILGWTPLHNSDIAQEAYICHTWGVNLESRYTTDGRYVFSNGSCDDTKYFYLMALMMCQIEAAANEVHRQTGKRVVMRVSKLGLGVWASALKVNGKIPEKYPIQYRNFLIQMTKNKPWLTIFHPDFDNKKTFKIQQENISDNYPGFDHLANTFADPFGPPDTIPDDSILLIINAWDDKSFIGNAGSHDNSLDGWIVSGSVGWPSWNGSKIGSNFKNACYLHNSFFHPSMFTDKNKLVKIDC